ncbi:uncharacterized protein LOC108462257 [Gossypium arboreum]|uniref:uncharacterized protein LOC108462257 n=1 Tax=Gossypium arboreum TaxID=29729 RepID=UPI0022F16885|nr:uncharacterized protein LOC108462257 [Gossypium arboreum]
MSTRAARDQGNAQVESSSSGHVPATDALVPLATEVKSHDRDAGDDALSQNCKKERGRNKRDSKPSSSFLRLKKKAKVDGSFRVGDLITIVGPQPCANFGRRNQEECWKRTEACLRCGSLENSIRECPQRPHQVQSIGLGTVQPLRDIGSTYFYIACTMSETLGILVDSTTSEVTVLSLLEQLVRVSKLFRDVPLEVQGVIFLADLMELPFGEFDLILEMDWLVKHRMSLGCATKRMVLRTTEDYEGCEAYLAYIGVSDSKVSSVKDIIIVKDLPNIFLDELLGLPPNREVEFGIELLPGTTPITPQIWA